MATALKRKKSNLDLAGAVIPRANLSRANLTAANFEGTYLSGADLSMSILVAARLKNATLQGANLSHADLSESDLTSADLSGADLSGAKLVRANLDRTNFRKADLRGANLKDAKGVGWLSLLQAFLDERTIVPTELEGDSLFQFLAQHIYSDRVDWSAEFHGSLREFLRQMAEQATANGHGFTIYEMLTGMASRETRDREGLNLGFRERDDR
jgi:hypothetical protein